MRAPILLLQFAITGLASLYAATVSPEPLPDRAASQVTDTLSCFSPASTHVGGFLGARLEANEEGRLLKVDETPLLAGFRQKPGSHPWIGEHVGKWLHAATLTWANSGYVRTREKIDLVAAELIKAQEADGYLGTYPPDKRFGLFEEADWDVWSHKYCLMGLLTYYQYTGNEPALQACRKMGDLLIATFGPGKKSILLAGTHVGMAATSVLEPMVVLYRCTGEAKYLAFAEYLVASWDEPNGPRILASLLAGKGVNQTANGKAYEMLSNLVGLCELYRVTGKRPYLEAATKAWADVTAHRLYVTGSASQGELFRADYELPNQTSAHIAETCVTTTWIQLNSQLLRLTGEARYARELERTWYNHLAAAQKPDGSQWCYYTALEGTKPYGPGINCCVSSGPRGLALVPPFAFLKYQQADHDGLAVVLYEPARFAGTLDGAHVGVELKSGFPRDGKVELSVHPGRPATFALRLRAPDWAQPMTIRLNGKKLKDAKPVEGWVELPAREWQGGDSVEIQFELGPRLLTGDHGNAGKAALAWGPLVLAYDQALNVGLPPATAVALRPLKEAPVSLVPGTNLAFAVEVASARGNQRAKLVPFADAGASGGLYRVWLKAAGQPLTEDSSILSAGVEARSRDGNQGGSINDGDPGTFVVTFDGRKADLDWYEVALAAPQTVSRVVFHHGRTFHDGGWFDASAGKPKVQVRRAKDGPWEPVGELTSYPATTATNPAGLTEGGNFTLRLTSPMAVYGVRVTGKPACGDNPNQAFSSCGELQALKD